MLEGGGSLNTTTTAPPHALLAEVVKSITSISIEPGVEVEVTIADV